MGIFVARGGQVTSTGTGASAATITLDGTGGGGGKGNYGVQIYQQDASGTHSDVASIDGAISITGHGGASATGDSNIGIIVLDGGRVTSTGTGADAATIAMTGTGGGGTQYAHGIEIYRNDARVTSVAGNISLTGQGNGSATGSYNTGILVWDTGYVSSTGTAPHAATVTLTGTGGAGTGENYGLDLEGRVGVLGSVDGAIKLAGTAGAGGLANTSYAVTLGYPAGNAASITSTGTAAIELSADSLRIVDTVGAIAAGTNTVTLKPKTAGTLIDLGGADSATTLGLSDAELDRITAGTLVVGDNQSGNLTVSTAISRAAATDISLRSGGTLTFNAEVGAAGGSVTVSAQATSGGTATVTTPTSAGITTSGASLGGNLSATGALAISARGVVYAVTSVNASPQIGGTGVTVVVASGTAIGSFSVDVSGLASSTGYSFAAYATNGAGTAYSSVDTFTTEFPAPAAPANNRFNPGGVQTETNLEPGTGVEPTRAPTDIITNLDKLDSRVGISDNGVVVVLDNGLNEPVKFRDDPPDNVLIAMPSQKPLDVLLNGNMLTVTIDPETPNPPKQTILGTTTLQLPDGTQEKGLQLVQGEVAIGNGEADTTIGGMELSKDTTLRSVTVQSGSAGGTAGLRKTLDGAGSVSAESGEVRITVRLKGTTGVSTLLQATTLSGYTATAARAATTDTLTLTLQAGDVARFDTLGELDGVFLGSLSGNGGKTGDARALTAPDGVASYPAST
ncbi:MAG: hypothetical protein SV422_11120, partial [Pseudomonadota bacterium]|nr:hypothetical protein [Pseudomonadota bacterium]